LISSEIDGIRCYSDNAKVCVRLLMKIVSYHRLMLTAMLSRHKIFFRFEFAALSRVMSKLSHDQKLTSNSIEHDEICA